MPKSLTHKKRGAEERKLATNVPQAVMAKPKKKATVKKKKIEITPPNLQTVEFHIVGTAPYRQNRFSAKALEKMREAQEEGSQQGSKRRIREPKDFEEMYQDAMHISEAGWCGIPATAFRQALISACRLVGFTMTRAKLALFCIEDGCDCIDGAPLVRITKGEPRRVDVSVRLDNGAMDIHPLPQWSSGWEAIPIIQYDADMFTFEDVNNLMLRVGLQVGIGEGRHDSKKSCGLGLGTFTFDHCLRIGPEQP